ncbi:hypothetical protein C2G38_2191186 [Gigaspora rosea]|uniref:Uncharacterized protein n=1 Tax=Gigaspora rosea TaxID=44941 RepID=A0A397V3N2_9GLOM|nr:hypothetical protein C2G38_2191186 [Gigaspora rosea]
MLEQNFTIQNEACLSGLPERIKKIIFIYVRFLAYLSVANNAWCQISKDNDTRAIRLIYHFDKAHALLHAIRLGPKFVNDIVIQKLLEKGAIISRYLIQRFLLSFGSYDPKLIEMKIDHNVGVSIDSEQIHNIKKLNPINESVPNHDLAVKGNDMETFHFPTGGPYAINLAKKKLEDNLNAIKDLITI